jgi:hypothetical protein
MMHHQTLMFFSLMGTVSVSVGAWCIALARVFWEQYGESIFFAANGVQVPAEQSCLMTRPVEAVCTPSFVESASEVGCKARLIVDLSALLCMLRWRSTKLQHADQTFRM